MNVVDRVRELLSGGGAARVLTWVWVVTWAEHAISSREVLASQILVALAGVVVLTWELFQDRAGDGAAVLAVIALGLGAVALAGLGLPRESGYLLAWGAAVTLVTFGAGTRPMAAVTCLALLCGGLLFAVGADPLAAVAGTLAQLLVVFLLQSLAKAARNLRRTQAELAQSEVDAERDRLAVEINTLVGLTLAEVSHQVRDARTYFADNEPVRNHLAEVDELVERGLHQLTQLSYEPVVDDLDVELNTAHTLCRRLGVEFTESVDEAHESVTPIFALALREATTNMFKHADPTRCTVVVRQDADEALFSLTNDGVRNAAAAPGDQGTGQNRMRRQVDAVGGTVEAGALSGDRYRVVVRVPTPGPPTRDLREDSLERNTHG